MNLGLIIFRISRSTHQRNQFTKSDKTTQTRVDPKENRRFTGGDVIERDAGAIERLLDGGGDSGGISVSGDGDGATVVHFDERGAYILRYGVGIAHLGHVTVLYIPPHRRLGLDVLLLRRRRHMLRLRSVSAHRWRQIQSNKIRVDSERGSRRGGGSGIGRGGAR